MVRGKWVLCAAAAAALLTVGGAGLRAQADPPSLVLVNGALFEDWYAQNVAGWFQWGSGPYARSFWIQGTDPAGAFINAPPTNLSVTLTPGTHDFTMVVDDPFPHLAWDESFSQVHIVINETVMTIFSKQTSVNGATRYGPATDTQEINGYEVTLSDMVCDPISFSPFPDRVGYQTVGGNGRPDGWVHFKLTVVALNEAPVADAGADQTAHAGSAVQLDGGGSSDETPETLAYAWSVQSGPSGGAFSDAAAESPAFTLAGPGTYVLALTVTDDGDLSDSDTVTITATNSAPVADAGLDVTSYPGDPNVLLDGSGSGDADAQDTVACAWSLTSRPAGSALALGAFGSAAQAAFHPDAVGDFVVTLSVTDGWGSAVTDQVVVHAIAPADFAKGVTTEVAEYVASLPASAFAAPGNQNALSNHVDQVLKDLAKGKTSHAAAKLAEAIERCDGWPLRGAADTSGPHKKDYVTNQAAAIAVYGDLVLALNAID